MYKVYRGGGGQPQWVEEHRPPPPRPPGMSPPLPGMPGGHAAPGLEGFAEPVRQAVESLFSRVTGELETEDLILLLILYLMYRESGDSEMLLIMGAMLLL